MTIHHHPFRHYLPWLFWDACALWWAACIILLLRACV
jgi:hypothetical protein